MYDIVLDEESFETASKDLAALSTRLEDFQTKMNGLLDDLQKGIDTPAGRKFIATCKGQLTKPINSQAKVINQVSTNLKMAQTSYETVFESFKSINEQINNSHY